MYITRLILAATDKQTSSSLIITHYYSHTHTPSLIHTHRKSIPIMAPITLYDITFGLHIKAFETFKVILLKAQAHSPSDASSLPSARLYEDMLPLSFQIQQASAIAKNTAAGLVPTCTVARNEVWEDNEQTLEDLLVRVDKTLAMLKSINPEDVTEEIRDTIYERPVGGGPDAFKFRSDGSGMAMGLGLPSIIFHVTVAYCILRNRGVPLGKSDFQTQFLMPHHMPKEEA